MSNHEMASAAPKMPVIKSYTVPLVGSVYTDADGRHLSVTGMATDFEDAAMVILFRLNGTGQVEFLDIVKFNDGRFTRVRPF